MTRISLHQTTLPCGCVITSGINIMPSYDTEPWKETEQCFDHREDVQALRAQWHNVDFNSVEFDGIKIGHYVVDVKEE